MATVLPSIASAISDTMMSSQLNGNRRRGMTKGMSRGIATPQSGMIENVKTADTPRTSRMLRHGVLQLTLENSTTAVTAARDPHRRSRNQYGRSRRVYGR